MRTRSLALLLPALVLAGQSHDHSHASRLAKGEGYVVRDGDFLSSFGSDEAHDIARRSEGSGLWFRKDGKAYEVRDAALVAAAKAAVEPMSRLGTAQGKLGAEQGKLGAQQGKLGAQQGLLGARMANSTPKEREALGAQMRDLGAKQEALGREQEALGAKQRELGRQQEAAADAAVVKLRALADEALAKGLARAL